MACEEPIPVYVSHAKEGLSGAASQGDGYSIHLQWVPAYPSTQDYKVLYNIYYSTFLREVFKEGVKAVSVDDGYFTGHILELTPGDTYYFAVRAAQYLPAWYDANELPFINSHLRTYPEAALLADISDVSSQILVSDIDQFPSRGIIQIGYELIRYSSKDVPNGLLLVSDRGYFNTNARSHTTDGYDGYIAHDNPFIRFFTGYEEKNDLILQATASFKYPHFPFTRGDGYRERIKDILNTDLSGSDAAQEDFPSYDYSGYHRTDPVALLNGDCLGTYYGGEQYCADGYGVGFQLRGISLSDVNNQRQEELLELTGEPVVLLRRLTKGVFCSCFESTSENPDQRCPYCYGVGFVAGYEQYYNPRRSDSRILVRFGPTDDEIKIDDDGLESVLLPDCWTLVVPALHSRDVIIRFNEDGTPEFRYEVLSVNRNKLLGSLSGAQKFKARRIRRTDPVYTWKAFENTATQPLKLSTSVAFLPGPGGSFLPHSHDIVISENIVNLSQINQTTSVVLGHNHEVRNGVVMDDRLGHTHTVILP
jgi:hypothetical protein